MKILSTISSEQKHDAGAWNSQQIEKYVFQTEKHQLVEATLFTHYKDGVFVKKAIEIATSYGCPMECKFCASGSIKKWSLLKPADVIEIIDFFFEHYNLYDEQNICLSITGTGEMLFTMDVIKEVILNVHQKYPHMVYLVSSAAINENLIKQLEDLSKQVYFRMIQLTYVLQDPSEIIKGAQNKNMLDTIISLVSSSSLPNFRINYILIEGVNDSAEQMDEFIRKISPIKNRISVHISTINETFVSRRNNVKGVSKSIMDLFLAKLTAQNFNAYIFKPESNNQMNCGQLISEKKEFSKFI